MKIGIGFAIHQHHITEVAIGVRSDWEAFVEKGSVGIEAAIGQSQWNIVGRVVLHEFFFVPLGGGFPPAGKHICLDQVKFEIIERQPEACQAFGYVQICKVFTVVVVPHGGRRFAKDWIAIVAHWNCIRVVVIAIHPLIDGKRRVAIGVGSIVTTV